MRARLLRCSNRLGFSWAARRNRGLSPRRPAPAFAPLALGARLAQGGWRLGGGLHRRLARLRLHPLGASSKLHPEWSPLTRMRDQGREAAERWLAAHFEALGRRATFDPTA